MPLEVGELHADEPASRRQEMARKLKRQYAEGDLVRVAGGRHLAEAQFIQGLLLEEGVPSILKRTAGFDVPDYLAAGPRDVWVPESGVDAVTVPSSSTRTPEKPTASRSVARASSARGCAWSW